MKSSQIQILISPLSAFSVCQRSLIGFALCFFVLLSRYVFFSSGSWRSSLVESIISFIFFFQVQKRFMDLLNLFKASSGHATSESTNEDSCSEDEAEDEEGSETIGDSGGEQAHDA